MASEKKSNHAVRQPIEDVIAARIENAELIRTIVDDILSLLESQNIISTHEKGGIGLLTPAGRVLCLLAWRPNMTVREMSVMLGTTETNINKAVSKLIASKLIQRKRRMGRYEYSVIFDNAKKHYEFRMLFAMIGSIQTG